MKKIAYASKSDGITANNLPIKNENLLLFLRICDFHVGDHNAVNGGGLPIQVDVHLQRSSWFNSQLVVD